VYVLKGEFEHSVLNNSSEIEAIDGSNHVGIHTNVRDVMIAVTTPTVYLV